MPKLNKKGEIMGKVLRFSLCLCLIMCFSLGLSACNNKKDPSLDSNTRAIIGNINYNSLYDAVENAKSGDTIKIYNNLKDNKNVVITKPLTIKGVISSNQIKPKFYGSITINLSGEEDSVKVENIDIVHQGTLADGLNNDTRFGINLVSGGLELKSCNISLDNNTTPDFDASGIVISRDISSQSMMPIIIKGNSFGDYETDTKTLSSAMIIRSNKEGAYKNLNLNASEIYNSNTFSTGTNGNQFVYICYPSYEAKYTYFATSSAEELIKALMFSQDTSGSTFIYTPVSPLSELPSDKVYINEKTNLTIEGNTPANFNGLKLIVSGSLVVNTAIENVTLEKASSTASIVLSEETDMSKITIL